jgi:PAS domain S-box-containing protein
MLRMVLCDVRDGICVSSRDGTIKLANQELVRMFGFETPEQMIGIDVRSLVASRDRARVEEVIAARNAHPRRIHRTGFLCERRDGSHFEADVRAIAYPTIDDILGVTIVRDPSKNDDIYRAIFEANTAIKLLIDPEDGSIIDANPAAAEFYGWPIEKLRTMNVGEINMLPTREIEQEMARAKSGRRRYFRFHHRTATGSIRHVEVHSGPVRLHGRTLLLSIICDLTDRDELEERLRSAEKLEALGRVAGGVAHDFNNLLTVVFGCASIIEKSGPSPEAKQALADLLEAANGARRLTQQLLAFSRNQKLERQPLDLNIVLSDMKELLQRAVGASGIEIVLDLAPQAPLVLLDRSQLEQVVLNLTLNARDAMPSGGAVRIETRAVTEGVAITVTDTGQGMDAATRARVFEPFFTTKSGSNTGLGLSTVYGIVTQSGGTIDLQSEPGRGTQITVVFPAMAEGQG